MQSGASDAVKTLTRLLEERLSTEEGQRRLGELASQIVYGARDRPGNHLKFCEVVPLEHGQWAVLGSLPWTDQYKKHYAVCPTIEAAYAAQRLLSGRAEKELREDERERRYETT
jgi:hypothetical protein